MNDGKICVSVCAGTADEMIANIGRAEEFADVVEVRFDCLEASEIRFVVDALPEIRGAYLFTLRPKDQGGKRELTLSERLKFWELIFSRQRVRFMIDIEGESSMLLAIRPRSVEQIVSMHDFDGVPENLDGCFDALASFDGNIVKIAVACDDSVDAISVWKLIEKAKAAGKKIIPIAMGEAGKWTRILALAHGAFLTYASLDPGKETAGGQLTARDLIDVYRVKELNAETKVYAVIGDPISQSLSPFLHNPAFAAAGDNAVFIHLLVKNIDEFITRMVNPATREIDLNFGGLAVTMPHKESIIKHLDAIDPVAEKIGAVNTINIENGMVVGYNTDAYGFITPLKETFGDLRGSRIAILGAGGTTRACIYALKNEGADVTVFVRDKAKAAMFSSELAIAVKQLPLSIVDRDNLPVNSFDILINATPIGMPGASELESLFTAQELLGVKLIYDLVTKPTDTPIIAEAKKAGIPTIGGIEMLIAQGARQFEIWMGREAPIELMRASVVARMNG